MKTIMIDNDDRKLTIAQDHFTITPNEPIVLRIKY